MPSISTELGLSTRSKKPLLVLFTIGAIVLMLLGAEAAVRARQVLKYGSAATVEEYYTVNPTIDLRVPIANLTSGRISIDSHEQYN